MGQSSKKAIEPAFLDSLAGKRVVVHLARGIALRGELLQHDAKHILISNDVAGAPPTLIYKGRISTVNEEEGGGRNRA